ncbi:leucyl/phenylalanyl-tRNA--protein transferase [Salinisphaera sp. P385]|uniref:Leucyl/phenylalanyl-tRNA--protein transferase n=1 Tax=Spectribacter acetivorans TaxID=3075603 RepID=A0ABU3B7D2_9GAMM|nr:leucyl/phenylalanyl-tRNA--protein transferase [Salinisphaera sp. P385]MDT0616906.1 leucyl/phenylalanyl-tRNA--protein transferase [Salinisphaera sp. P385]
MTNLRLYWLDPADPDAGFPDPALALHQPNGLLAMGGDLSPTRLVNAYRRGIFPWYNPEESILWWSPDPRAVFATDAVHVSRRLARIIRQADFAVTLDTDFSAVLDGCAAPRGHNPGTWLGSDMRAAYRALHQRGLAHSIEFWRHGQLAGGLYGVALGRVFYGESMFSRQPNASRICLTLLARQLARWGFPIIDGQVGSPHLYRMGAFDMPRTEFLDLVRRYGSQPMPAGPWQFDLSVPAGRVHLPDHAVND